MDLRGRFAWLFQAIDLLLTPVHPFAPLSLATIRTLGGAAGAHPEAATLHRPPSI